LDLWANSDGSWLVDSGIHYTHEGCANMGHTKEIAGNGKDDDTDGFVDNVYGINAITGSGDPADDAGHGTHVAGIIGAVGNNQKGIAGVAWRVRLMACKFMDSTGRGGITDAVQCIDFADARSQIINASWGGATRLLPPECDSSAPRASFL
jgi:subtilisin family serine protease